MARICPKLLITGYSNYLVNKVFQIQQKYCLPPIFLRITNLIFCIPFLSRMSRRHSSFVLKVTSKSNPILEQDESQSVQKIQPKSGSKINLRSSSKQQKEKQKSSPSARQSKEKQSESEPHQVNKKSPEKNEKLLPEKKPNTRLSNKKNIKTSKGIQKIENTPNQQKIQGQNQSAQKKNKAKKTIYSQEGSNSSQSQEKQKGKIKRHRKIVANQLYQPKKFSEPFNILKSLYLLQAHRKPIAMQQVEQKYKTIKESPFRHFHHHGNRLEVNEFIRLEKTQDQTMIRLLDKGVKFIAPKANLVEIPKKESSQQSHSKKKSKQEDVKRSNYNQSHSQSKQKFKQVSQRPKNLYFENEEYDEYPKEKLCSSKNADKVQMLINENATSLMEERACNLTSKLDEEGTIKYSLVRVYSNVHFFWEVEHKILDCFVFFMKGLKTDLQILKQAISEGKYCNCSKFIILAQVNNQKQKKNQKVFRKDEEHYQKVTKDVDQILFQARAAGLRVFKTMNQDETIAFLRKLTSLLSKKIRHICETGEPIKHYGSLDKLNQWLGLSKTYNHRRIFIKCLKRIRGFRSKALKQIAEKLPSFTSVYQKMLKLNSNQERVRFLEWLLQNCDPNTNACKTLVNLLFLEEYCQPKLEKSEKENDIKEQVRQYQSDSAYIV